MYKTVHRKKTQQTHKNKFSTQEIGAKHVLDNLFIFFSMHKYANSEVNATACSSDLLVVGDDGVRSLIMNNEAKVRLVKAHTERRRCYKSLDAILKKTFLEEFAISI